MKRVIDGLLYDTSEMAEFCAWESGPDDPALSYKKERLMLHEKSGTWLFFITWHCGPDGGKSHEVAEKEGVIRWLQEKEIEITEDLERVLAIPRGGA